MLCAAQDWICSSWFYWLTQLSSWASFVNWPHRVPKMENLSCSSCDFFSARFFAIWCWCCWMKSSVRELRVAWPEDPQSIVAANFVMQGVQLAFSLCFSYEPFAAIRCAAWQAQEVFNLFNLNPEHQWSRTVMWLSGWCLIPINLFLCNGMLVRGPWEVPFS